MALEPITRQEKIIAGQDLTPITRMEKFLKRYGGGPGGVTSWNDLTDKPFGEVTTVKEVLAECQGEWVEEFGFYGCGTGKISLEIGQKYTVVINGTEYTGTGFDASAEDEFFDVGIVNDGADMSTGDGLEFVVFRLALEQADYAVLARLGDDSPINTISIRQEVTEVKKISGKYVEGMGWSEGVGENLFKGGSVRNVYNDLCTMNLDTKTKANLNIFKSYDITIRGDVYKDVKPTKVDAQYWYVNWGSVTDDWSDFPFTFCAIWGSPEDSDDWHSMGNEHCPWDIDGNWVGHIPPYSDHVADWMEPILTYRIDIYPDLKPEEIQIREVETIHPIDPKFLPNVLVTIDVVPADDGSIESASMTGASFDEILSALKSGLYVGVHIKNPNAPAITMGTIVCFNDMMIGVVDQNVGAFFIINPDNSVVID